MNQKILSIENEVEFIQIFIDWWNHFGENPEKKALNELIHEYLSSKLSHFSKQELEDFSAELLFSAEKITQTHRSFLIEEEKGASAKGWLERKLKEAFSGLSAIDASVQMQTVYNSVSLANRAWRDVFTKLDGQINMNPNLNGFLFEQHHASTFNINAAKVQSPYRAEVLSPARGNYARNSVDIVIKNKLNEGAIARRYQAKACTSAAHTCRAFANGNYRGQRKLVPEGHCSVVTGSVEYISSSDGVASKPVSKIDLEKAQKSIQAEKNYNNQMEYFTFDDPLITITKQASQAAKAGFVMGAFQEVSKSLIKGERIKADKVFINSIENGCSAGTVSMVSSLIKVAVEKKAIKIVSKKPLTPPQIAAISMITVENLKTIRKYWKGEIDLAEAIHRIEVTIISVVGGLSMSVKGAALGAAIGVVLGPVGAAIGSAIGGMLGYVVGSEISEKVVAPYHKLAGAIITLSQRTKEHLQTFAENTIISTPVNFVYAVADWVSSWF